MLLLLFLLNIRIYRPLYINWTKQNYLNKLLVQKPYDDVNGKIINCDLLSDHKAS